MTADELRNRVIDSGLSPIHAATDSGIEAEDTIGGGYRFDAR